MIYSLQPGSPFWHYVLPPVVIDKRTVKANWRVNQIMLARLPPEIWYMVFQYIFSWKLPARYWQWVCLSCRDWNNNARVWKKIHASEFKVELTRIQREIPEERLLREVCDPDPYHYRDTPISEIIVRLRQHRPQLFRPGYPPPPSLKFEVNGSPLDEPNEKSKKWRRDYEEWWTQWGIGPQLNYWLVRNIINHTALD